MMFISMFKTECPAMLLPRLLYVAFLEVLCVKVIWDWLEIQQRW
jgi:hypothetical protein